MKIFSNVKAELSLSRSCLELQVGKAGWFYSIYFNPLRWGLTAHRNKPCCKFWLLIGPFEINRVWGDGDVYPFTFVDDEEDGEGGLKPLPTSCAHTWEHTYSVNGAPVEAKYTDGNYTVWCPLCGSFGKAPCEGHGLQQHKVIVTSLAYSDEYRQITKSKELK